MDTIARILLSKFLSFIMLKLVALSGIVLGALADHSQTLQTLALSMKLARRKTRIDLPTGLSSLAQQ